MSILQISANIVLLLIMPLMIGGFITLIIPQRDSLSLRLLSGYIIAFAVFDLLVLPSIFLKLTLGLFSKLFFVVMILLSLTGFIIGRKTTLSLIKEAVSTVFNIKKQAFLLLAMLLILGQTIYVASSTHIDDDDAFYVATAETAVASDTLMEIDPYTGEAYTELPARYMLSPVMIWNAAISKITHTPPVITAHTILPCIFIPLSYMVYYLFADLLERRKKIKNKGLFLLLVTIIFAFSGYSVYSQGTFLLTRIWQGKAMLAAFLLPAVLLYLMMFFEAGLTKKTYIWMFFVMTACCLVSEMGIMLGMIAYGAAIIVYLTEKRSLKPMITCLLGCLAGCLVNIICAVAYIILK